MIASKGENAGVLPPHRLIAIAVRLPLARLTRSPRAWIPLLAWAALAIISASVLRRGGSSGSTAEALEVIFGQLALPLLAFSMVGTVLGGDGLARSTRPLATFGAPPKQVALATIGVAIVATAIVAAVLGAVVAALAHGVNDPPVVRDAFTSAWVAAFGGGAYVALFALGASFGKRGGGRALALVADWIFGSGTGAAGMLAPRAHVRSLLGGDAVMGLSGRTSALVLAALVLLFAGLAIARTRRA
jgi:hypothetical protein